MITEVCDAARLHLQEGLARWDRHGFVSTRALILSNLAEIAIKTGDLEAGESHPRRAIEVAEALGNRWLLSWLKLQAAHLA